MYLNQNVSAIVLLDKNMNMYNLFTSIYDITGNGLVSTSREPAHTIASGSQDWTRPLHRKTPTFHQAPPTWTPHKEEREKESVERDREISIERRREEDRER